MAQVSWSGLTSPGAFLSRGILAYEQLVNVGGLLGKERMYFVGVPLNAKDSDGMIVRPVVFVYQGSRV